MRRPARERHEKRENSRPILKRLRAALLQSFREQHREKMVYVKGVPGITGTLKKANSYFDQLKCGRGSHHQVEASVDWCSNCFASAVNFFVSVGVLI